MVNQLVLLSDTANSSSDVLPALDLLGHKTQVLSLQTPADVLNREAEAVVMIDARESLVQARNTAQILKSSGLVSPLLMVLTEGGLAAVSSTWLIDDILLNTAGPAEVEARLRLATAQLSTDVTDGEHLIRSGEITVDEASYTARLAGEPLNLTYKEFELLKFLAQHPGRVFTRAQLLSEVWGYDYYGGTRTVDVHVRRLRSKLGSDHENLISTVRNVGYSFSSVRGES
ncbi:winged helix-turn-helix transcriptional regulator [Rothia sp. ZJ1223]|nr:winged helix-turn-helix domain-containing protein [Rothia sp. ZJ1223]MBM7051883.1 winged helix-turn-helix transcriptional regulator [Rothia sp. ZJ1223]